MTAIAEAAWTAAERMRELAERVPGDRSRRAGIGALVLRAAAGSLGGVAGEFFLRARAMQDLDSLPRGPERSVLRRVLALSTEPVGESWGALLTSALIGYAAEVEKAGRLMEADTALTLARTVSARDPEVALHAARVARKLGDPVRAAALYGAVAELDAPCGRFGRLASIGGALLAQDAERALGREIRAAVLAGDMEAAAVGLEERARVRRSSGDRAGSMRDFCTAAARFVDPVDRARVGHELADLAIAGGDGLAAREALLVAADHGDPVQRLHARSRLYMLARAQGDELGMRRWRITGRPALVSLGLGRLDAITETAAPVLARWRSRLERAARRADL